jgi:hypothetical protein
VVARLTPAALEQAAHGRPGLHQVPATHRHHVGDPAIGVEYDEVGVGANLDAALVRQAQEVGGIGGERREYTFEGFAPIQQCAQCARQRARAADLHLGHPAIRVEHGEAAAPVRTDRDPVGRQPGIEIPEQRVFGRPGVLSGRDRKRGHIDRDSAIRERHRLLEEPLAPVDMRGVEDAGRNLARLQRLPHEVQPAGPVAEMQVGDAALARHQPCHVRLAGETKELVQ